MSEFEVEEAEGGVPAALVLADVTRAPRRCLCGHVRLGDEVAHHEGGCRPFGVQRGAEGPREAYPAPEVTSRDAWDGQGAPAAMLKLAEKAVEAGWNVRVQRSRGCPPHASHGTPGAVRWLYALKLRNGEWSAYAVHSGGGWSSIMLWGRERPWFPGASVTDLAEYVSARGALGDEWYDAIRERERSKGERSKARAACDRGTHPPASVSLIEGGVASCSMCGNSWIANAQPWRKAKKGKSEAL